MPFRSASAHPGGPRAIDAVVTPDDSSTRESEARVHQLSAQDVDTLATLQRTLTANAAVADSEPHSSFQEFFERENRERERSGQPIGRIGVCFKGVTTWGAGGENARVKTYADAVWRTATFRDVYEWTLKKWFWPDKIESGRPLIQDFSGVLRPGEMMLVLGRPGSGCSTFLRTIANDHSSFLGITGSIDYSGLQPSEIRKNYRGEVAYTPEEDRHFPTLTVRQVLEFALQSKTPKRNRHEIPQILELYCRVFGVLHILDSVIGNEYIRGISGGERKRISIIEALCAGASVEAWDNSTRGLDAASALDYARSLRIMTDTCRKATFVSIYQASEAVYKLFDKVLVIDGGKMIYQGPANLAREYFESLGYQATPGQTTADFLTAVTSPEERQFRPGWESRTPKGPDELEAAFRRSSFFRDLEENIRSYEEELTRRDTEGSFISSEHPEVEKFRASVSAKKSKYVSYSSSYNTSFVRQVCLCVMRQWWLIRGDLIPMATRLISCIINALLIGSMFYDQPQTSDGIFSRGGFIFYSSVLVAWIQLVEVEDAIQWRDILARQKRFAIVRPSAVGAARLIVDIFCIAAQVALYSIVAYFMSGLKMEAGAFFTFMLFQVLCALSLTALYRTLAEVSPSFEVAMRYCGVMLLLGIIYGGYMLSLDSLIADVPWVGWLAYATPVLYAYEAIMAAEFHGLNFTCSPSSIIPSGPNYTNSAYQTCAYPGSKPGELFVIGDSYLEKKFQFYYSNVWRDFGILILFTIALSVISGWLSETIEWENGGGSALVFKNKKTAGKQKERVEKDEENVQPSGPSAEKIPPASADEDFSDGSSGGLIKSNGVFTWRNIHYSVPTKAGPRKLLDSVSGYCRPGHLTALVGPSGAGKSTLMSVLTQRQGPGELSGEICVDGKPIDGTFQSKIGYCQQMDVHDETATVQEALEFAALLRQPSHIPREEKIAYVKSVLKTLDLLPLRNVLISCLTLEQKRRISIAVELCARPALLLFLDEPTSGLDSQGAMNIVRLLRRLADQGQAVLCTIHQASPQALECFDRILAVQPGGRTYYFGEIGAGGQKVLGYLQRFGIEKTEDKALGDLLMDAGSARVKGKVDGSEEERDWGDLWSESEEAAFVLSEIEDIYSTKPSTANSEAPAPPTTKHTYPASTFLQARLLTERILKQYWRTPEYPYSRLYASVIHSLLIGLTFLQVSNTVTSMQSRAFAVFLILMIVPEFVNVIAMKFIENRSLWLERERPSRTYNWAAFATAQILPEIPFALGNSMIYYILFYFLVGLPKGGTGGYVLLMTVAFHLFATSWGQWIAALSRDATMAANLMPFFVIVCELFNGILRPQRYMPVFWKYTMYYLTPFTYWIGGMLSMVLDGVEVRCAKGEAHIFNLPPSAASCAEYASSWLTSSTPGHLLSPSELLSYGLNPERECGYCEFSVGNDYLEGLMLGKEKIWMYCGIFLGFVFANYLIVYLLVWLGSEMRWGRGRR